MKTVAASRLVKLLVVGWAALVLLASPATAFEAIGGRLQAHGYYEMQLRTMSADFVDQWDVTQWYNIFNLELELDIVQDSHGPLDLLSAFVRVEARFDCIYSRGCGIVPGIDVYGNRARKMPARLNRAQDFVTAGTIFIENDGPFANEDRDPLTLIETPGFKGIYDNTTEGLGSADRVVLMICQGPTGGGGSAYCPQDGLSYTRGRIPARFWNADRNRRNRAIVGDEAIDDGTSGAPFLIAMQDFTDFEFAAIPVIGGANNGHALLLMGPWLPENLVVANAALGNLPNPLDTSRISPQSLQAGSGGNPMRPIPIYRERNPGSDKIYVNQQTALSGGSVGSDAQRQMSINETSGRFGDSREWDDRAARPWEAHGGFTPSAPLRRAIMEEKFTEYPFNISEIERAFNRGASQNDEGELKEAYLDIEMFDSRLWLRVGKQSIVWGKTELFRTTDQFNPQDLALATLPSLEESRINLWAIRGVWSFYEVGPLSDVRVEMAMNFDEFESADLGACGEPYAVNLVCALTFGSWAHGLTGIGIAGFSAPPNPWEDSRGIEFGGRVEWRWDRFSFALTDFYGYNDFPHPVRISSYNRNVDWRTGRPRYYMNDLSVMVNSKLGCATPSGEGVQFGVNPFTGGPDLTDQPSGPGSYVDYSGAGNAGCLTRAPNNRTITNVEGPDGEFYGVPYRVPLGIELAGANDLSDYTGGFLNDQFLSGEEAMVDGKVIIVGVEERYQYSKARSDPFLLPAGEGWKAWQEGPNAGFCDTDPRLAGHPDCDPDASRGRRKYNTQKYITVGADTNVPNPDYNPFYDPRIDQYFDASQNPGTFEYAADPGGVLAATPVRYDPFQVNGSGNFENRRGPMWWMNAYDPSLEFDLQAGAGGEFSRNALDSSPLNLSLFNFVCSTTVGFSDLDPASCALNVFSSTKEPGGSEVSAPRISFVISAFLAGDEAFNGFLGKFPSDPLLGKGTVMPSGMGMPLVRLNADYEIPEPGNTIRRAQGLGAFRTWDTRRNWQDRANGYVLPNNPNNSTTPTARTDQYYPWIYTRESESYNCLPNIHGLATGGGVLLCGGLAINSSRDMNDTAADPTAWSVRYQSTTFLARMLTPEQEAIAGCGPYFFTNCDANGSDLLWAEGSGILQSFTGSDSVGISLAKLGIEGLVPRTFGASLMDNGSPSQEYRTDGRVVDRNGNLIRIGDIGGQLAPALGSKGLINTATSGRLGNSVLSVPAAPCVITAAPIVNGDPITNYGGAGMLLSDRTSARCWDLRRHFVAYGVVPGTSTFESLQLGGPKCTTADIGGPLDPKASVLPGCRNKWNTIAYQPLDSWDGVSELHPNNPDAGYIGNNFFGTTVFSYKAPIFEPDAALPSPRTDYRQWSSAPAAHVTGSTDLANEVDCGTGTPSAPGSITDPQNYDCYLLNPVDNGLSGLGPSATVRLDAGWGSGDPRYAAAEQSLRSGLNWGVYNPSAAGCASPSPNDPNCYLAGWRQTVDGDPDPLGLFDDDGSLTYPKIVNAFGIGDGQGTNDRSLALVGLFFGQRVEHGCTPGRSWAFIQRTADNQLLNPADCVNTFVSPDALAGGAAIPDELQGGTGHPFTGESFSSEVSGLSWNLMMTLVAFSDDFRDGLASVRGYVNPEIYESRYIYDEEWMWNPACTTANPCNGRAFIPDPTPPPLILQAGIPHSVYGDPNRDLDGNTPAQSPSTARIRQVTGWRSTGIANVSVPARPNAIPNPLPSGVTNKLQRDPSLPNIMTDFPDLLMFECQSAADALSADPTLDLRSVWEQCGTAANGGAADWRTGGVPGATYNQALRLGTGTTGDGTGLVQSMLWDYAFTGTENDLMAMIPFCENLEFAQRHTRSNTGDDFSQTTSGIWGPARIDCSEARNADGSVRRLGRQRCTFVTPQYCDVVQSIFSVAGQKRNIVQAGGNGLFGRRTSQWHSGSEVYLGYDKRNVLGFSTDFAEDYTKSNWSMEFTWIGGVPQVNNNAYDLTTDTDDFNLTVSVDRPTFINFLNANRTFFINSQWFFQYRKGWESGMTSPGPWNVLATFSVFTGYFQDRLNPTLTMVFDFQSTSGAALPQVNYRFSENFSITVGASLFMGSQDLVVMPVNAIAPAVPRSGPDGYYDATEPGLSIVRDRDEVFMTLRYTF